MSAAASARRVHALCRDLVAGRVSGTAYVSEAGVTLGPAFADVGPAVVLATSGASTGTPNRVLAPVAALRASAEATTERLGGPGEWLSILPAHFVGGFQVLFRAALAGIDPVLLPTHGPLSTRLARAPLPAAPRRYLSVVPAQLRQALDAPADDVRATLASCDAILVGGDALTPALRADAERAGLRVVSTYGMTETCGGCVYDGVPLAGVEVRVGARGRIELGGPQLVAGYLDAAGRLATQQPFVTEGGRRWLVTGDVGTWDGQRLTVAGRADDVIVSGGRNVVPTSVEAGVRAAAGGLLDGLEWAVSSVPDDTWGSLVVLAVAATPGARECADAALARCAALPSGERPRVVVVVPELPRTASGKLNRRELAAACARLRGR